VRLGGKWDTGLDVFEGVATTIGRIYSVSPQHRDYKTDLLHRLVSGTMPKYLVDFFVKTEFNWGSGYWCDGYADNISLKLYKIK